MNGRRIAPKFGHSRMPEWVPDQVVTYLAHVEGGDSLRTLARKSGCHASTVLRQVRRCEGLRDDPLADAALSSLGSLWRDRTQSGASSDLNEGRRLAMTRTDQEKVKLERDKLRALRALADIGALLVIAEGVEDAVVVTKAEDGDDRPVRRAIVSRDVAEVLALNEWILGEAKGRIARYRITATGRSELQRRIAEAETARISATDTDKPLSKSAPRNDDNTSPSRGRTAGAEPPLRVLARRKRSTGEAFLSKAMVQAAERFRESYEIARAGGAIEDDLDGVIRGEYSPVSTVIHGNTMLAKPRHVVAHESLDKAIRALGPELAETVLLSCCREAGMEVIEDKLDFPARSGKIILRIALGTLMRHYAKVGDEHHDLIY